MWIVLAVIVVIVAVLSFSTCINTRTTVNYSEFYNAVKLAETEELTKENLKNEGADVIVSKLTSSNYNKIEITDVVFDGYVVNFAVRAYISDVQSISYAFTTVYSRGSEAITDLENRLETAGIDFTYTNPNAGSIWSSLIPLIGCALIAIVFFILIMQTQGGTKGAMTFAKTNARVNRDLKVRFSDVAGAEEEKAELAEVVEFLKSPRKFKEVGARIPKGVLLVGPPGTGKTLFAKSVAGESGVPFFSLS